MLALTWVGVLGCVTPEQGPQDKGGTAASAQPSSPRAAAQKIEWTLAPDGPVGPLVAAELQQAKAAGRRVLVYVGATWCEPCRHFHDAVKSGVLDAQFGALRIVEFDLDRDGDRLREAGYAPKFIPLLALPGADGRATGKQMEGSIKGAGAVGQMAPRLAALLNEPR